MQSDEIALSTAEFEAVKRKVYDLAGISLSDAKRTLVVSRLSRIVRRLNLVSFADYLAYLDGPGTPQDAQEFVNALTTNLTRFFREDHHFAHLVDHVGELIAARRPGRNRLRIWSAGCSTGQEPYTIALALMDAHPTLRQWDFKILATDIDTNVVATAARGVYKESDLAGLDPKRASLFEAAGNGMVRIPAAARSLVTFKPLNLMGEWPFNGPFDAIFCRNVAIYFDRQTQTRMFSRMAGMLAPHAYMYIGHSENLGGCGGRFELVGKTIYRPARQDSTKAVA